MVALILDMDNPVSETYGEQEGTAYNGHFGCTCNHPLFCFNQFGEVERSLLREGKKPNGKSRLISEPPMSLCEGQSNHVSRMNSRLGYLICFALLVANPTIDVARADYFTNGGSMTAVRTGHTATSLPNGEVLATGGRNNSSIVTSSADLYDPTMGTWTATASMISRRVAHAANLLSNGEVLVSGGLSTLYTQIYAVNAEIFNPANRTWSAAGALNLPRFNHTATTLLNGMVVIVGGDRTNGYLSSVEIYDPTSNIWTLTNSITIGRDSHTATLLPSGKVLVAGGFNGVPLSDAQLYDPSSGTWNPTMSLQVARENHTATLLTNGLVLVAGGFGNSGPYLSSAELYDPTSETWTLTGALHTARYAHTATLLSNGKVLVAGGLGGNALSSAELYDPGTGRWTTTSSLNYARAWQTANSLPNGEALVAGGYVGIYNVLSNAELYVSIAVPVTTIVLTQPTVLSGNALQFSFTNTPGASFSVLSVTNLATPSSNWPFIGNVTEVSAGQFQFTDTNASNYANRFYRVRSP